jgi:hypothetical protein
VARCKQRKQAYGGQSWSARANKPARRDARGRRLSCESLEDRRLLSGSGSGISSLSGYIFQDSAKTGSYSGQAGVVGAAVELVDLDATGVTYAQVAVTNASGYFSFATLNSADEYQAIVRTPRGYTAFTTSNVDTTLNQSGTGATATLTSTTLDVGLYGTPVTGSFATALGGNPSFPANTQGDRVTSDASGNVYVTGSFEFTVNFDPGLGVSSMDGGSAAGFVAKYTSTGALEWVTGMLPQASSMGFAMGFASASDVAVDGNYNVYVTGTIDGSIGDGTINFNNGLTGPYDLTLSDNNEPFIAKYDANGNLLWAEAIEDPASVSSGGTGFNVLTNGTSVYLSGSFSGTLTDTTDTNGTARPFPSNLVANSSGTGVYTIALDPSGTIIQFADAWSVAASGTVYGGEAEPGGMALSPSGNDLYSAGTVMGTATLGSNTLNATAGYQQTYVADFNIASQTYVWAELVNGEATDATGEATAAVAVDNTGTSASNSSYGDLYVTGQLVNTASPSYQSVLFLEKLNPSGVVQGSSYQATASGNSTMSGNDIAIVPNGAGSDAGYIDVGGDFSGTVNFSSASGSIVAGSSARVGTSVSDGAGLNPAGASSAISSSGSIDGFIAQFSPHLACQWVVTVGSGGTNSDEVDGLGLDPSGDLYATGSFEGTAAVQANSMTAQGNSSFDTNAFLIKIAAPQSAPSFILTGPGSGTFTVGQSVTIQWTAANVDVAGPSTISLGYDPDTTAFDANQHWIEVDQVTAANGAASYGWNTTGVAPGTYYLSGYMFDDGTSTAVSSHLSTPIVITGASVPTFKITGPTAGTFTAGTSVTIQWTAANVDTAGPSKISLGYDPDITAFDVNEQWIELLGVVAANGAATYSWNTTGVAAGTYYLSGYMHDPGTGLQFNSSLNTPIVIASPPLFALTGPTSGTFTVGQTVTIQWTAAYVDTAGPTKISLGYDPDMKPFDANQHWIETLGVTAANGAATYNWNTTGVAPGTYYLNGYMVDTATSQTLTSYISEPIVITSASVPAFTLAGPTAGTFTAGTSVTIQWTAANVDTTGPSKITLGYDPDATAFDANQHWLEVDGVTAANGAATYSWNTTGVAAGTYYLSGYMYDFSTSKAVYSHLATPIVITGGGQPTFTLGAPSAGTFAAGTSVTIQWTAANVDTAGPSKITLGYDPDATAFDTNQHWLEVDGVTAANGAATYSWNTTGVAAGTYYLSGYMYDFSTSKAVYSHMGTPIVITGGGPPAFTLSAPSAGTFAAGTSVTIQWTAANVDTAGPSKITLGYDPDATAFDANQHWLEVDGVTAVNGAATYSWNTTGVAAGTYYLSGYMYDFSTSKAVYSHMSTPIVITGGGAPAFSLSFVGSGTFALGACVTVRWSATNVDTADPCKITLGYDPDCTSFDCNQHWLEIDGITAINGTGTFIWNTAGLAPATYYLDGYMYDFTLGKAVCFTTTSTPDKL